jgi:hypothetical protein
MTKQEIKELKHELIRMQKAMKKLRETLSRKPQVIYVNPPFAPAPYVAPNLAPYVTPNPAPWNNTPGTVPINTTTITCNSTT